MTRRRLLLLLAALAVAASAWAIRSWFRAPEQTAAQQETFERMQLLGLLRVDWLKAGGTLSETEARRAARGDSAVHLLFLGVDRRKNERGRSDAIHLLRLEPGQVTLFSVPRDSLITIHGDSRPDKINHCYAYGGHALIVRKLEDLLAIRIDGYLEVDLQTFVRVARIAKAVTLDGRLIGAEEIFSKIDGLLSWLRNRSMPGGDVRRVARQQLFIARSLDWTLSLYRDHPGVLRGAVLSILKTLPTDITVDQVMVLCQIYADEELLAAQAAGDGRPTWSKGVNAAIARMERFILPGTPILVDPRTGARVADTALLHAGRSDTGGPLQRTVPEGGTGEDAPAGTARMYETSTIGPAALPSPGVVGPPHAQVPAPAAALPAAITAGAGEDSGPLSVYQLESETRLRVLLEKWRSERVRQNYEDRDEILK